MSTAIRIYRHALSGHSHRVQLFASLVGLSVELVDVDLASGEHKQAPFLALNSSGKVPVIVDGDIVISDSNAILVYLARKYAPDWLPTDLVREAEVQKLLSFAAGEIANGPAAARLATVFGAGLDAERAKSTAHTALSWLDDHLAARRWLVGDAPSIADVAVFSYTAHAPEGNVSLEPFANVRRWLRDVAALPGFVGMQETKVGLVA